MQMGSKQFRDLQAKWYRKLEKSGFKDIEENDRLIYRHGDYFKTEYTPERFAEKKSYFEKAKDFLSRDVFIDGIERRIWALHTAGFPIRRIVLILASEGTKKNKNEVNQTLNELQEIMLK